MRAKHKSILQLNCMSYSQLTAKEQRMIQLWFLPNIFLTQNKQIEVEGSLHKLGSKGDV